MDLFIRTGDLVFNELKILDKKKKKEEGHPFQIEHSSTQRSVSVPPSHDRPTRVSTKTHAASKAAKQSVEDRVRDNLSHEPNASSASDSGKQSASSRRQKSHPSLAETDDQHSAYSLRLRKEGRRADCARASETATQSHLEKYEHLHVKRTSVKSAILTSPISLGVSSVSRRTPQGRSADHKLQEPQFFEQGLGQSGEEGEPPLHYEHSTCRSRTHSTKDSIRRGTLLDQCRGLRYKTSTSRPDPDSPEDSIRRGVIPDHIGRITGRSSSLDRLIMACQTETIGTESYSVVAPRIVATSHSTKSWLGSAWDLDQGEETTVILGSNFRLDEENPHYMTSDVHESDEEAYEDWIGYTKESIYPQASQISFRSPLSGDGHRAASDYDFTTNAEATRDPLWATASDEEIGYEKSTSNQDVLEGSSNQQDRERGPDPYLVSCDDALGTCELSDAVRYCSSFDGGEQNLENSVRNNDLVFDYWGTDETYHTGGSGVYI